MSVYAEMLRERLMAKRARDNPGPAFSTGGDAWDDAHAAEWDEANRAAHRYYDARGITGLLVGT